MSRPTMILRGDFGGQPLVTAAGALALACLVSLASGWAIANEQALRLGLAAIVIALLFGLGMLTSRHLLYVLVLWLAALGLLRRLATYELAAFRDTDPLLVVGPIALGVLLMNAVRAGAFRGRTPLATAVAAMSGLILLGAVNPLQDSLVAGIAGLLFTLVPALAFWVGRGLVDDEALMKLLKLLAVVAVASALYGFVQIFVGFPHWDAKWIRDSGYTALQVFSSSLGGTYRPFASFSSASEYGLYLALGIVVWAGFATRRWSLLAVGPIGVLAVALLYQSSRGIVVGLVAGLALMLSARRALPLAGGLLGAVLVVALLPFAARQLPWHTTSAASGSELVSHQLEGLANPLDPAVSTLPGHVELLRSGLSSVLQDPIGLGLAPVTLAGRKFGRGEGESGTEADPSNIAVALGIPGLLAYLVVVALAFRRAYHVAVRRRDALSLAALGILMVTLFQWLNGAHYAVAIVPWLVLGWLDRPSTSDRERARERMPGRASPQLRG